MAMTISPLASRWFVLVMAGAIVAGMGLELLPIAVVRAGAVGVLLAQVILERRVGSGQYLTSPLFLLGTMALVFFSLAFGVGDTTLIKSHIRDVETFFGSDAERIFVTFGLICIVVHGLIAGTVKPPSSNTQNALGRSEKFIYVFAGIALIMSLANLAGFASLLSGGSRVAVIGTVTPPVLAFCLIFLTYQFQGASGKHKALIIVVALIAIAGLFFVHEGKKPIFIIVAGLLFWLRLENISFKKMILSGLALVIAAIVLLQISQMIREPRLSVLGDGGSQVVSKFRNLVHAKLVWRQLETRSCFQNIIDEHGDQPVVVSKQAFWVQGLVPRVIWPEKPSLSLGVYYANTYCGVINPKWPLSHSASITLLGQPVIQGGWHGLLLHGGILIAALGGLVWLGRYPGRLATVSVVALLPWLIDFDQDFALYVANAVKFFLVMLPLIALAAFLSRNPSPT